MYRKLFTVLLIALLLSPAFLFAGGSKEGSNEVVIYTALEEDETADYLALAEKELPIPRSWADLTKPEYAGEIIMPNPGSSGTGYLQVSSILLWKGIKDGSEAGGDFLGELHKNIVEYTNSGSAPAKTASIRPEQIEVLNKDSNISENVITSKLVVIIYPGLIVRLIIRKNDHEITVDILEKDFTRMKLERGQDIKIHFPSTSFLFFNN